MNKSITKKSMFNEAVKNQYIEYASSTSDSQNVELYKRGIANRFFRSEKLEKEIGKDIYQMDKDEAKWFLTQHLCGGTLYQINTISTLYSYVEWAIKSKIAFAKENSFYGIKVTDIDVSDSYVNTMVKDEYDLIESLDIVLDVIDSNATFKSRDTVDNTRLCIFLLIFAGIPFKDLFYIKKDAVDLENRVIMYGAQSVCISDFLYTVLKTYLQMGEMQKIGKGEAEYTKMIIDEGYLISNTKEYGNNRDKIRLSYTSDISQIFKNCSKKLNPSSILDSGIFYRMYSKEKETGKIDYLEYLMVRKNLSSVINFPDRVKKTCQHEYETWKRAFNM